MSKAKAYALKLINKPRDFVMDGGDKEEKAIRAFLLLVFVLLGGAVLIGLLRTIFGG